MLTVTVCGISAHVSETGEGEPVVLLHSGAGEARDWRRFSAELPAGYRCAALDFYGCGGTPPWPGPRALTIDDQAHLAATLARSIGMPVHLCGHSYGGAIALRLAVTQPELDKALNFWGRKAFPAVASRGDGVMETFVAVVQEMLASIALKYNLKEKGLDPEAVPEIVAEAFAALLRKSPLSPGSGAALVGHCANRQVRLRRRCPPTPPDLPQTGGGTAGAVRVPSGHTAR